MNLPYALTVYSGSILVVILVIENLKKKFPGNSLQKKIFNVFLILIFIAMFVDFIYSVVVSHGVRNSIWPFISAMLLFVSLFIIQNENYIDNLTGLNNRYSFFEFTGKLSHSKDTWTIVMIDVNNFKLLNKIYGNREGDNTLFTLSRIIKNHIGRNDFAARYGGDEFVVATKVENGIEILLEKIKIDLDTFNESSGKPYDIHIDYVFDILNTSETRSIDNFLLFMEQQIKNQLDENRRAGDSKINNLGFNDIESVDLRFIGGVS